MDCGYQQKKRDAKFPYRLVLKVSLKQSLEAAAAPPEAVYFRGCIVVCTVGCDGFARLLRPAGGTLPH